MRARIKDGAVHGPLFDAETDLLALAEEILDMPSTTGMVINHDAGKGLADRLIMLDIARSLRQIAQREASRVVDEQIFRARTKRSYR